MYKLIVFTISSDSTTKQYIQEQLESISKLKPNLPIEHVNENDDRLNLFIRHSDKFPAYLITKLDRRKSTLNGKLTFEDLYDWVNSNVA